MCLACLPELARQHPRHTHGRGYVAVMGRPRHPWPTDPARNAVRSRCIVTIKRFSAGIIPKNKNGVFNLFIPLERDFILIKLFMIEL